MTRHQKKLSLAVAAALSSAGLVSSATAQTTVYQEQWGAGIAPEYTVSSSTTPGGAAVQSGQLVLQNNLNAGTLAQGHIRVSTPTSGGAGVSLYDASHNTVLDANGDGNIMIWDLNIQQNRNNPSGFGLSNTGVAYVLGATNADFLNAGSGYAVVIGTTSTDPLLLVRYDTNGIAQMGLNARDFALIQSGANANTNFQSVRVTYTPATNAWRMYVRDDGTTAFTDAIATPVPDANLIGLAKEETPIAGALTHSGFLFTHTTTAGNNGKFDNIRLVRDTAPNIPPRNLIWDADASGAATDGSGTFQTANSWIDTADNVTHHSFDGGRPDNAIFGAGSGAGSASINMGTGTQFLGKVTFNAGSPTYTLSGGTITAFGSDEGGSNKIVVANQSAQINSRLNVAAHGIVEVASGATLTVGDGTTTGGLSGSGRITKTGTGSMTIASPANARAGHLTIEDGTVNVPFSSVVANVPGTGNGNIFVKNSGTLHLDATGGAYSILSPGGIIHMGDGGTLKVSGNVTYQRNFPEFKRGTLEAPQESFIHVESGGQLLYRAQIRNDGTTTENFHTIHIDGPGIVKLTNAGSNGSVDSNLFGGSWDLSNGKLVLGQNTETGGSSGDTLNTLGFKGGSPVNANTVTVRGTGTLVGTENTPNGVGGTTWYRANVIMSGGTLSSGNGKDTSWGGHFTTTAATTSTIATYDPLNPTIARNVSLVAGTPDGLGTWLQGDTTWDGNLVVDAGTTTGGKFVIARDGGTINVTSGATITVNQGATLELGSTADALSDGIDHVNVANNSTTSFNVVAGSKNVGNLTGSGNTNLSNNASLTARQIRQGVLNIGDGSVATVRAHGGADGVLVVNTLNLNTSGALDLKDNDLVVNNGSFSALNAQVLAGATSPTVVPGAINSTTTDGSQILAMFDNALVSASDWQGIPIGANATVGKYTYFGDANIDGQVTGDDYTVIDANLNTDPAVGLEWLSGDMNLDGIVTGDDYTVIDANLGLGVGNPLTPSSLSAVPEPGSLGVLAAAGTGLLMRRRRSR